MIVITPEMYKQRRKRLMRLIGSGLIIVPPNPKSIYSADKYYKYRQNSNILYLSGIEQEESIIVLDVSENKSYLFVLDKDPQEELWHGKRLRRIEAGEISGFMMVYPLSEFSEKLRDLFELNDHLHYPSGVNRELDDEILGLVAEYQLSVHDPTPRFDTLRLIKDEKEIELIEKSISITVDAHLEAIQQTEVGMAEYELEAIYQSHFRYNGAALPMHQAIVAAGINGIYLHHMAAKKILEDRELVLVDTGCEYQSYTSDVARTWPVNGKFTAPQRQLYEIVLSAHKTCVDMVKPGVKYWDIHDKGVEILVDGLIELGILKGDAETIIENEDFKQLFPHSIGHFLGIDGHDCSTINRQKVTLQPGMYLTIEPGIYVPADEDIDKRYHNIGIRIEDNILVTESGHRNLSEDLPIEIEEIEELVGSEI